MRMHGSVMVCLYSMAVSNRTFYVSFPWFSIPLLDYCYSYENKYKCFSLHSLNIPLLHDRVCSSVLPKLLYT
jgi:hypothetical protein